jgi:hypothetical protein
VVLLLHSRATAGCRRNDCRTSTPSPVSFQQNCKKQEVELSVDETRDNRSRLPLMEAEVFFANGG